MTKHMSEDKVQELIKSDELVQERIKELLDLNGEVEFIPEDSYINGITHSNSEYIIFCTAF